MLIYPEINHFIYSLIRKYYLQVNNNNKDKVRNCICGVCTNSTGEKSNRYLQIIFIFTVFDKSQLQCKIKKKKIIKNI